MSIRVEVSNLGPLRAAEAELADLTLLIGENNTGKTFFATVLHRILGAPHEADEFGARFGPRAPGEVLDWFKSRLGPDLKTLSLELSSVRPTEPVLDWVTKVTSAALETFGADVRRSIEYAFGVEATELRRRTPSRRSSDCYLRIRNTEPDWGVEVRFDSDDIVVEPPDPATWLQTMLDRERAQRMSEANVRRRARAQGPSSLRRLGFVFGGYWPSRDELFPSWPSNPVHLPGDRTGIMQSYQVLAGAVVRQSAAAGIRPIRMDSLPGTAADFLSMFVEDADDPDDPNPMPRRESPVGEVVAEFEKELRAEFVMKWRPHAAPSVSAVTPEGVFPPSRASSMLTELAPILLALKGDICRTDHLTIDEPEAHLHPAMQRRVASLLVDVVNNGIGVTVTTHSDFFLGEINNLIRAGRLIGSNGRTRMRSPGEHGPPTVCAMRFGRNDRWCVGRALPLDPVDGIDESTFTEVMESLYDESARLIDELI